jgi:flagellar hook-basal body complex protein FliE
LFVSSVKDVGALPPLTVSTLSPESRYLSSQEVSGHIVRLNRSDVRHLSGSLEGIPLVEETPEAGFGKVLARAFGAVNDRQRVASQLERQMLTDPGSVNVHDITIAMAEANLSLSMTKAIVDRALRAYREIISTR